MDDAFERRSTNNSVVNEPSNLFELFGLSGKFSLQPVISKQKFIRYEAKDMIMSAWLMLLQSSLPEDSKVLLGFPFAFGVNHADESINRLKQLREVILKRSSETILIPISDNVHWQLVVLRLKKPDPEDNTTWYYAAEVVNSMDERERKKKIKKKKSDKKVVKQEGYKKLLKEIAKHLGVIDTKNITYTQRLL